MSSDKKNQCYACDTPATGREHVPPKCLFPTELGPDFRKNLITVPSCEEHNTGKSDDDEFLLVNLAGIIGCNKVGLAHKFTKVNRAIRRTGGILLKKALKEQRVEWHELGDGKMVDVTWGKPDMVRLSRCFGLIGKGLYRNVHDQSFKGEVKCEIVYVPLNDRGRTGYREFIVDEIKAELANLSLQGENPAVFQWVLGPLDAFGACCGKMIFYGNLEVYLGFIPDAFADAKFVTLHDMAKDSSKPVYIVKGNRKYRIN